MKIKLISQEIPENNRDVHTSLTLISPKNRHKINFEIQLRQWRQRFSISLQDPNSAMPGGYSLMNSTPLMDSFMDPGKISEVTEKYLVKVINDLVNHVEFRRSYPKELKIQKMHPNFNSIRDVDIEGLREDISTILTEIVNSPWGEEHRVSVKKSKEEGCSLKYSFNAKAGECSGPTLYWKVSLNEKVYLYANCSAHHPAFSETQGGVEERIEKNSVQITKEEYESLKVIIE